MSQSVFLVMLDSTTKELCHDPWHNLETKYVLKAFDFWIDGLLTLIFSLIGIIGNLLTIIVFNCKELRSTFHASLSVLVSCMIFLSARGRF